MILSHFHICSTPAMYLTNCMQQALFALYFVLLGPLLLYLVYFASLQHMVFNWCRFNCLKAVVRVGVAVVLAVTLGKVGFTTLGMPTVL